jgi:hypothetical protein
VLLLSIFSCTFVHSDEIAGCSEKAYDSLSVADAKKILMFSSDRELQGYVIEVCPCSLFVHAYPFSCFVISMFLTLCSCSS